MKAEGEERVNQEKRSRVLERTMFTYKGMQVSMRYIFASSV